MGLKRADKRRLDELRVEFGMKESSTKKLVRSRLKCAGHMDIMGDKNIGKESRCPESKRKKEATKIKNAMGGLR